MYRKFFLEFLRKFLKVIDFFFLRKNLKLKKNNHSKINENFKNDRNLF